MDPRSKQARDVSNILYQEVRKHDANRHLIYVLDDDDFRIAAQERDYFNSRRFFLLVNALISRLTHSQTSDQSSTGTHTSSPDSPPWICEALVNVLVFVHGHRNW